MAETVTVEFQSLKAGDEIEWFGERCLFVKASHTSLLVWLSGPHKGQTVDPIPSPSIKVQKITAFK